MPVLRLPKVCPSSVSRSWCSARRKKSQLQYTQQQQPRFWSTMSEEEVVDHLPALKESCAKHCPAQKKEYDACISRITKLGEGDCEAWYFDLLHCVDHCVAPQAFKKLK